MTQDFRPRTETDKRLAAFKPTMKNRIQLVIGGILFAAAFVAFGLDFKPTWLSLIIGLVGGFLVAKGRGVA